jgi:hypothetical protein
MKPKGPQDVIASVRVHPMQSVYRAGCLSECVLRAPNSQSLLLVMLIKDYLRDFGRRMGGRL